MPTIEERIKRKEFDVLAEPPADDDIFDDDREGFHQKVDRYNEVAKQCNDRFRAACEEETKEEKLGKQIQDAIWIIAMDQHGHDLRSIWRIYKQLKNFARLVRNSIGKDQTLEHNRVFEPSTKGTGVFLVTDPTSGDVGATTKFIVIDIEYDECVRRGSFCLCFKWNPFVFTDEQVQESMSCSVRGAK